MKAINSYIILLIIFTVNSFSQEKSWIVGADASYNLPVGSLSHRFLGNFGFLVYAGKNTSEHWTWVGKFEYFNLNTINEDYMNKTVITEEFGVVKEYKFNLPDLKMDMKIAGLSFEARYKLFSSDIFNADLNLGFGFYYWEHFRSSYYDSLYADTTGQDDLVLVEVLNVPELEQKDWSGGINVGGDFNFTIVDPVQLNLGFNYKIIIAELWPTLALNLESISGLQFLEIRAGLRVKL